MAETFLSHVIEKLIQFLTENVAESLEGSFQSDVKNLKEELQRIQPLLKDADTKYLETGDVSKATKAWVRRVREKADHIEDIIDEYLRCEGQDRDDGVYNQHEKPRRDITSEIRSVKDSLRDIKPLSGSETRKVARRDIVGIGATKKEVIRRLTEGESSRSVISLVGQDGIGKTTLAWEVYDDDVVKGHFDCRAWITVSQSCDAEKLLRTMTSQILLGGERMAEESTADEATNHLRQYLVAKRYVIVFDDVGEKKIWEVIKHSLPENEKGSRIIITTRNAVSCKENPCDYVLDLKPWSLYMAWELFCKKAFGNNYDCKRHCSEGFKQLCCEIISKCEGLPCIISTVARLLSTKERVSEWRGVLEILGSENDKINVISKARSLMGYFDLPYHLKTCLLYFVVFPRGHRIYDTTLYGLWIADGLVKAREDKTLEEVAEEYLNELIQRNLVAFQVIPGESKLCQVDYLLHEMILSRADELFFCQIWDQNRPRFIGKSPRLAIFGDPHNVLETIDQNNELRSVFLFNANCKKLTKSFVANLFEKFKLLKVVSIENAPLYNLPDEVESLFHLDYLSLKYTALKKLPKSIGKLRNLQSLDVRYTLVEELPIEINKLRKLRQLLAYNTACDRLGGFRGLKIHEGFGCLESLQTLTLVEAHPGIDVASFVKVLEKLKQLRWLDVCQLTAEIARALCASIAKMNRLERICLASVNRDEILDINDMPCSDHLHLWDVLLIGPLKTMPDWIPRLRSLRSLVLQHTRLVDEPIQCLKGLTNLEGLFLMHNAYDGEELLFEEGFFEKLKSLTIRGLKGLKMVRIDKGALPLLEVLLIVESPLLKKVETIEHLTNTKQLLVEIPQPIFQSGGSVNIEIKGTPHYCTFVFK